jgi:ankyrin repeat protein
MLSACVCGQTKIVELLLDRGVDVNGVNSLGFAAAMVASRAGRPDVVKVLLMRGAASALKREDNLHLPE